MISEMNFLERIIYLLQNYGMSFLQGAGTTLAIAIVSTIIGCIIGFAVGIVQTIPIDPKRDGLHHHWRSTENLHVSLENYFYHS